MPEIIFENSGWWLLPIALVSLAAAWVLYFVGKSFTTAQRRLLFVLRFFIFFLLGILLLSPLLKITERNEEKPFLVWLEDHSYSMLAGDDSAQVKEELAEQEELKEALSEKYRLRSFDFSSNLVPASDSFSQSGTDINQALGDIQERFYNQNLGGLVMLSDGIFNQGSDPSYTAASLPFPVYTVGYGDTTVPRDLFIDRIVSNEVSYLDNEFPVEIYAKARQLEGEDFTVSVTGPEGKELYRKSVEITSEDFFQRIDFFLKAREAGLQRYQVNLITSASEENKSNNSRSFTIEVISNRKKVAIIGSSPHPDLAAISSALEAVEKYEVKVYSDLAKLDELDEPDLVVLHNPGNEALQRFTDQQAAFWIIQGENTQAPALAQHTSVTSGSRGFEEVTVSFAGNFDLFKVSEEERSFLEELPPLWSPFGRPEIDGQTYVLLHKKIGAVETQDPNWFFMIRESGTEAEQRQAFTLGTGLWRWRIHDYRQNQSHQHFDGLVQKTVQYLTTKAQRDRFDVNIASRFNRAENIITEARLYNSSMELDNEPEVSILFTGEEGESYEFSFSRARNTYSLNAGRLPAGVYNWEANTRLGDESFKDRGSIVVEESKLEQADLVARHNLLQRIASESGGKFYQRGEWQSLQEDLMSNPEAKSYQVLETTTGSIIDKRWLFAIFLFLMAAEWGLRKYFGRY